MPPPVLIVEDDHDIRGAMRDALEGEGFPVVEAAHGQQALARLQDVRPSVILLDLMMPVMSGWDLYRALKSDPAHANIPIVVVSALNSHNLAVAGSIRKPFDIDELLAAVRKAMPKP